MMFLIYGPTIGSLDVKRSIFFVILNFYFLFLYLLFLLSIRLLRLLSKITKIMIQLAGQSQDHY